MSAEEIDPQVQHALERAFGDPDSVADVPSGSALLADDPRSDSDIGELAAAISAGVAERVRKRSAARRARRGGVAALVACAAAVVAIAVWPHHGGPARIQTVDPAKGDDKPATTTDKSGNNANGSGRSDPSGSMRPVVDEDVENTRWIVESDDSDVDKLGTISSAIGLVDVVEFRDGEVFVSSCGSTKQTWALNDGTLSIDRTDGPDCKLSGGFSLGPETSVEVPRGSSSTLLLTVGTRHASLAKVANLGLDPIASARDVYALLGTWRLPGWDPEGGKNVLILHPPVEPSSTPGDAEGPCLLGGEWSRPGGLGAIAVSGEPAAACVGPPNAVAAQVVKVLGQGANINEIGGKLVLTPWDRRVGAGVVLEPWLSVSKGVTDPPSLVSSDSLRWTVAFVRSDDTLAVRDRPNVDGQVVARLSPGASNFRVGIGTTTTGFTVWRQVQTADGVEGYASARFLVAQPNDTKTIDWDQLQSMTTRVGRWVLNGTGDGPGTWLAPIGLQMGGLLTFGDAPSDFQRIAAMELVEHDAWTSPRTLDPPEGITAQQCGNDCRKPLVEALGLSALSGSFSLRPHDIATDPADPHRDGPLPTGMAALPSVTIDVPATSDSTNNWQRIHVFFDWSSGDLKVIGIYRWGWTP